MSELEDIVEGFKKHKQVVVTGPQRSGTQIAGRIIADILDWEFVDEREMCIPYVKHDTRYFDWMALPKVPTVLQCPRISHVCHQTPKPTLVVFMMRDVEEIIASDKHRVETYRRYSMKKHKSVAVKSVFIEKGHQYSNTFYDGVLSGVEEVPQRVYDVWNTIQKQYDFNWYELDYNILEQHPLWVPLNDRRRYFTTGTQSTLGGT